MRWTFGRKPIRVQPIVPFLERNRDVATGPRTEADYRHTFLRDDQTRHVLADILSDLGFFRVDATTGEDLAELNTARRLLAKLGLWNRNETIDRIVGALGSVNVPYVFDQDAEAKTRSRGA